MVELATFRMFHRASPAREPEILPEVQSPPVETATAVDESLSTRFTQELRARRRAARVDMRQSEVWAEPVAAPPPLPAATEPVAFSEDAPDHDLSALAEPAEPVSFLLPAVPEAPVSFAPAPDAPAFENAAPDERDPVLPIIADEALDLPIEQIAVPPEEAETYFETLVAEENFVESAAEHLAPPPETLIPPVDAAAYHQPSEEEEPPLDAAHEDTEPEPIVPPTVEEFLSEPIATPEPAPVATAVEEPWPVEPPLTLVDGATRPIPPPQPQGDEGWSTAEDPTPVALLPQEYRSDPLALDYRLLGLANPMVCTVIGTLGDSTPIPLSIGRAGIYRPDGFQPAPWSGLGYDVAPDGRTGLALGTHILTARGEIPVEDLIPGDTALALRGPALLPIIWIGRSIAGPPPVEIAAGAFGPGRPGRMLRVGPEHPIFMETMPVAARELVNGDTIRSLDDETVELFHVDVGFAEVLLAEGIPLASGCR